MYVHYTTNTFQDNICTVIHAMIKQKDRIAYKLFLKKS